jgi:hypothetical protein
MKKERGSPKNVSLLNPRAKGRGGLPRDGHLIVIFKKDNCV